MQKLPALISLAAFGNVETGFLVSTQKESNLPFVIKRVFWVQHVPPSFMRGQHAGYQTEEVIICIRGRVVVQTESKAGRQTFVLNQPDLGLYVPAKCWIELTFSQDALLLCLASTDYDEQDYISDYAQFQELCLSNNL